MTVNQIGAVAPKHLGPEFWNELVSTTLKRSLVEPESEEIITAYERNCASRPLDPAVIVGIAFPHIVSADGKGYLEVQATSLAVDSYGYEVEDEKAVVWDAVVTTCLIPTTEGGR